jgi:hypothetical protein
LFRNRKAIIPIRSSKKKENKKEQNQCESVIHIKKSAALKRQNQIEMQGPAPIFMPENKNTLFHSSNHLKVTVLQIIFDLKHFR